ncbi:unnamed protein product [Mytilus edulis]|uniref:Uncharacterized protein n=1 Tax=Mytilus edulis TaxID=6550 RepID=A0A8S3V4S0_MYTED|nr:unnamed protein product [Mytilus edulis]
MGPLQPSKIPESKPMEPHQQRNHYSYQWNQAQPRQTMLHLPERPTAFKRSHVNKSIFVKPRDITLESIVAANKYASQSTKEDTNVLNLKKYIPNLSKSPDVLRQVRLLLRKNMNYRKNKEDLPADKPEPQVHRMPTDYLSFDPSTDIPDYLQCGSEVCLEYQGYPVCKSKDDPQRRNTDVAVFPYKSEYRRWEKVGKGARFAWCVSEVKPVEIYDNVSDNKIICTGTWCCTIICKRQEKMPTEIHLHSEKEDQKNQPTEAEPEAMEPDQDNTVPIQEPEAANPVEPEPEAADPVEPEPEAADPVEPEPEAADPVPEATEPVEPEPAEPEPEHAEVEMLAPPQQAEAEPDERIQVFDYVEVSLKDPKRDNRDDSTGGEVHEGYRKQNIKVWPQVDDISIVEQTQIVRRLSKPTLDKRHRCVFVD